MATIKLIQREDKLGKNGTAPIYLRITENRKTRQKSTGVRIPPKDWNPDREEVRKSNPDFRMFNEQLDSLKLEAKQAAFQIRKRTKGKGSASAIKSALEGKSDESFSSYLDDFADSRDGGAHMWDARNIRVVGKKLKNFTGQDDVLFGDIDRAFLRRFDAYMENELGNAVNTRSKNLETMRRVYRNAIKDGVAAREFDPFLYFTIKSKPATKEKLSVEEISALDQLEIPEGSGLCLTRDAFLFSYYAAGVRFGDLCALRASNVQDDRLTYTMMKSGKTKSIKLQPPALEIINRYLPDASTGDPLIFPILDRGVDYSDPKFIRKRISARNALVNKHLKKLARMIGSEIKISFHMARHSFATHASQQDINVYKISKLLGHSKIQTTQTYLDTLDHKAQDDVMDEMFGSEDT